jgi:hypothetical protein
MRFGAVATMTAFVAAGFVTFVPGCQLIETRSDAGGSSGGTTSSGGKGSGGKSSSGGSGSGGAAASGGTTAKGGSGGSGGSDGDGGTVGSGGVAAKGGDGGTIPIGGNTARGGRTGATGGITAPGGSGGRVVSNCTDTPPPNQTPTCEQWASYNTCSEAWFASYCDKSCGRCTGPVQGGSGGGAGGRPGSGGATTQGGNGGASGPGTTNPPITGSQGWASRYWDCCKPSCGWTGNSNPPVPSCGKDGTSRVGADQRNGCEGGGSAFECYDFHPWYDAATNLSYGFVAKNGVSCGACFMLQFTGDSHNGGGAGAAALKGQQMVVQAINIGGIEQNQFDLLIPGGGVGAMNGCSTQWGSGTDLGVQYGGLLSECGGDAACMKGKCESVFGKISSTLKAGCDWFTGWFSSADNPNLIYKQVSCPQQLSSKTGISR